MSRSIEEALADCLEKVEKGGLTPEEALLLYPELRAELEPLLDLTAELRAMPKVEAPARLRGYKRPVFRAAPRRETWWRRFLPTRGSSLGWATPLAQAAAALALVIAAGSGTVVASANSLPDEPLYSVKLAVENAQLAVASNDQARAEMELQFASRRLAEMQSAAQQDKPEAVAKGAELYQQQANAAVKASEAAPSSDAEAVKDSLRNNVEVLRQVQEKVGNERAKAAIGAAIDRTIAASGEPKGSNSSNAQGGSKQVAGSEPTAAATSTPASAVQVPRITPSPTATLESSQGHEPPGKATGRPEQPGNSGQGNQSETEPQGQGQSQGHGQAQERKQVAPAQEGVQPTETPVPAATPTHPGGQGEGRSSETNPGNSGRKATAEPENVNPDGKDRGNSGDNGKGNQKKDLLGNLIENIQKFVTRR